MKPKKFNARQNMMLNIVNEGAGQIWSDIERIKDPFTRLREKHLYFQCLKKLRKGK